MCIRDRFKSCDHIKSLIPIVNVIKQDRDDSRKTPPEWVRNNENDSLIPEGRNEDSYDSTNKSTKKIVPQKRRRNSDSIFKVEKGEILLSIRDWDVEDKDTISIYLNNKLLADRVRIRKAPLLIKKSGLRYGENYLLVKAMNTQRGSNTSSIKAFSDRSILCDTNLLQGFNHSTRLTLLYK